MERREFLSFAAIAAMASAAGGAGRASAQPTPGDQEVRIICLFANDEGESHFEDVVVAPSAGPLPVSGVRLTRIAQGTEDWHTVPAGQFSINIAGDIEAEASNGDKRQIGPGDLVYIGDTHGKGHVTRLLTPVSNLFISMQEGFDIKAWASGEA